MNVVCDTNPLIYLLTGNTAFTDVVADLLDGNQVWISVITELELYGKPKLTEAEIKSIDLILEQCLVADLNQDIKEFSKLFMQKYSFRLPDAVIAATSHYLDFPLITADKQFTIIDELHIILIE